ncbi:MAG: 30S ribosomal protein S4 [Patescibacteria group bacterium]
MSADPKCKICRRAGEKLFLKGERCFTPKCAMIRHPSTPGIHGGARKGKRRTVSEFGIELREKQKIRFLYGLTEGQFERYVEEARKKKNSVVTDAIVSFLETRLDSVVFRAGFAVSRSYARHCVSYGHICVNGKLASSPGYRVKKGFSISIYPKSEASPLFKDYGERIKKYDPPTWISLDKDRRVATIIAEPTVENTQFTYDLQKVIQFYSK